MNIGGAAKASGISAKMIRYYELIGLAPTADRTTGGYRDYSMRDVHRLRFIRRSRDLGFSLARVRDLLKLWSDRDRHSADVKAVALAHVRELEARASELQAMIKTLRTLARQCGDDDRPDCPIIDRLEAGDEAPRGEKESSAAEILERRGQDAGERGAGDCRRP